MNALQDNCPKCGTALASSLCPQCLLHAGMETTVLPRDERPAAPREAAGSTIGRYKLLEEIGDGGFGVVYLAQQTEPVKREVALKIIKPGMDTREVVARFEAERQALALMDHPNIARVFDGGATEGGRPYFVMELVKGVPLTKYCDDARLGTKQRLELFLDVLAAVQHAHQKGIIHRDLKPSNILVALHDGKPVIKVIDFGIAKAISLELTEKTLFTGHGRMIGTPQYMSPEQTLLNAVDVDTRSDLYSLGVVLYELLTGRTPIDGKKLREAGYDEIQRMIREEEPTKPSTRISTLGAALPTVAQHRSAEPTRLTRQVRGDLDWIVMKALEKERKRRYETANSFAADIRRYLADEPVSASPPSRSYRLGKLVRKHRGVIAAAAAVMLAIFVGAGLSIWQAVAAMRARDAATLAERTTAVTLVQVAAERDAKDLARKDAEDISKFLGDVLRSPDPKRDGREIKVVELLDNAARKLDTDLADRPERRAKMQTELGLTYRALGLARQAIPLQEKVLGYHLSASGPHHSDSLDAMNNLANSYDNAGRRDEALKLREEVLVLRRKVNGPEHPDTLIAIHNLGLSYCAAGRRDEAIKMHEEALLLSRKVNGAEHPDTLGTMNDLASSYYAAGRKDDALKLREEVLALRRKVNGPKHPDTLTALTNLALSYRNAGRQDEALKLREEVLALRRKVLGPEHPDTLGAMNNLAFSLLDAGRLGEALKMQEEVLALRLNVIGQEHPDTLGTMHSLARCYELAGRKDEALKLRKEVLALRRKVLGPEHSDTLAAMNNLANSYADAGRREEALKMREQLLPLRRKVNGPEHSDTLIAMNNLANSYADIGRPEEALKIREELLPLRRKVLGAEHHDTLAAMTDLAISYGKAGRLSEAVVLQEQSIAIKRRVLPPNHHFLAVALSNLARLYEMTGRNDEAAKLQAELEALKYKN